MPSPALVRPPPTMRSKLFHMLSNSFIEIRFSHPPVLLCNMYSLMGLGVFAELHGHRHGPCLDPTRNQGPSVDILFPRPGHLLI